MVTRGYYINLVELRGHTPPNMWSKGRIRLTLPAPRCCHPSNAPETNVRVLGMGCGHLASGSKLILRQVGARGSVLPRERFAYHPVWPKEPGGIPLFDHFSLVKTG